MSQTGYYRFPTIYKNDIVFVCEDDLWTVAKSGGVARRLTNNPGRVTRVAYSPDGSKLAFTGRDESFDDVYVMPSVGGNAKRITHLGMNTMVAGWTPDNQVVYYSSVGQPFDRMNFLYAISPDGGQAKKLPVGTGMSISFAANSAKAKGACVIGRNTTDIARWKRYKGGRTGELWIDTTGKGNFKTLIDLEGNAAEPLWIGKRIYFVSDHEGIGNLYSTSTTGKDLQRHTHHEDFYVRHPSNDSSTIVYHAGADLYVYDVKTDKSTKVEIDFYSSQPERKRKFVSAERYLQDYALHPNGKAVAINTRGKLYSMNNWEGAVLNHGDEAVARYSNAAWLHDGKHIVLVSDASGEERLELHNLSDQKGMKVAPTKFPKLDIGHTYNLLPSPTKKQLAISNQRNELLLVDLENLKRPKKKVLDRSEHYRIFSMAWSPDGRWLAYSIYVHSYNSVIKLYDTQTNKTYQITDELLYNSDPSFDPDGKYLYFMSHRSFNPMYDSVHFDYSFVNAERPYLVTLQADTLSPFVLTGNEDDKANTKTKANDTKKAKAEKNTKIENDIKPVEIDLEGIQDRIVAFPVPAGSYGTIKGIKGKVLFTSYQIRGTLNDEFVSTTSRAKLEVYDFKEQKHEMLVEGISGYDISQDASTLIYEAGNSLRVIKAGEKLPSSDAFGRKGGWLDLGRLKVSVVPQDEWAQMLREAWRRQRDYFWTEDMSGIDWAAIYIRYAPLVDRVATRSEVSDLFWEMQGELGTSHAYELGGDYKAEPRYYQGYLGIDTSFEVSTQSYRIDKIIKGDVWDTRASSPLARAGLNIKVGDKIVSVDGEAVSQEQPLEALLVNQAGNEILLGILSGAKAAKESKSKSKSKEVRYVTVKTLYGESQARYRDWVEHNRAIVHKATEGRIGYIHIPDMQPPGYAEFHRGLVTEAARDGLIVDVRYNRGGNVSQLLLEILSRKQRAFRVSRWRKVNAVPYLSFAGPLVAITNEFSGSDGDIFSHSFKLMDLGPLVGKRTWGGVVGTLGGALPFSDGSVTKQPENGTWFTDVGWQVENYGTDPTIEVDIRPQDWVNEEDPQLQVGLKEVLKLLKKVPEQPDFSKRPNLAAPKLPKVK